MGDTLKNWLKVAALISAFVIGFTFLMGGPKEAAGVAIDIVNMAKGAGESFMIFFREFRANV